MANNNQTSTSTKKISNYISMIVAVVMALAVIAIILAVGLYYTGTSATGTTQSGYYEGAGVLAVIGAIALSMSGYTLFQSKRQVAEMKIEIPKVMTTIGCTNSGCATKTVREFQRGDYVYKELDKPCEKCGGKQMVVGVYKEVKEKEKTYAV